MLRLGKNAATKPRPRADGLTRLLPRNGAGTMSAPRLSTPANSTTSLPRVHGRKAPRRQAGKHRQANGSWVRSEPTATLATLRARSANPSTTRISECLLRTRIRDVGAPRRSRRRAHADPCCDRASNARSAMFSRRSIESRDTLSTLTEWQVNTEVRTYATRARGASSPRGPPFSGPRTMTIASSNVGAGLAERCSSPTTAFDPGSRQG